MNKEVWEMTSKTEVLILVSLHNFFNLGLVHKGWFYLDVDLKPNALTKSNVVVSQLKPQQRNHDISERALSAPFHSKLFYIEYVDQDVLLESNLTYRVLLDTRHIEDTTISLEFKLYHSWELQRVEPPKATFREVGHEKIALQDLLYMQSFYYPLHFDKNYLSLTNTSIFITFSGICPASILPPENVDKKMQKYVQALQPAWKNLREELQLSDSNLCEEYHPQMLKKLCERVGSTLNQLWEFESACRSQEVSGNVIELRQQLVRTPSQFRSRNEMSQDLLKMLGEMRKQCRQAVLQHINHQKGILCYLFEQWKDSRSNVWAKYIRSSSKQDFNVQTDLASQSIQVEDSDITKKLKRLSLFRDSIFVDEKFRGDKIPKLHTDFDIRVSNPKIEAPAIHVLRLQVTDDGGIHSNESFDRYLHVSYDDTVSHVVFFVHGFYGSPSDLRYIYSFLNFRYPSIVCHYSKTNHRQTHDSFHTMGERLATEIVEVVSRIAENAENASTDKVRVSFVGHSIGNIIIRTALTMPKMQHLLKNLWTFLSISGPHLGYMKRTRTIQKVGLFLLRTWNVKCIAELTMSDAKKMEDCFLYKLSHARTFSHFRHVLLVASKQDGYVAQHSATLTPCATSKVVSKRKKMEMSLLDAVQKDLDIHRSDSEHPTEIYRCIVDFPDLSSYSIIHKMIGRAAHVELLCSTTYIRVLVWCILKPEMFGLPKKKKEEEAKVQKEEGERQVDEEIEEE